MIATSVLSTFSVFFALGAVAMLLTVPFALLTLAMIGGFNLFYLLPTGLGYISIENLFGWDNFLTDFGCSIKYLIILIS